jgi:type VI secretion system protein ImpG
MEDRYFTEEMAYLLEQGREFAKLHPQKARMLHLDDTRSRDPNVERLLESFAFLTSRIRKKLDEEFTHIADGLLSLVWPGCLDPIPSFCFVQFEHRQTDSGEVVRVPAGAEMDSLPLKNGVRCRFRTCYETPVFPLGVRQVTVDSAGSSFELRLSLSVLCAGPLGDLSPHRLRIQLLGEIFSCWQIYNLLLGQKDKAQNVRHVRVVAYDGSDKALGSHEFSSECLHPIGLRQEEALLPGPASSLWSYGLLRDFFAFPEKYQGLELDVLSAFAAHPDARSFDIVLSVDSAWPANLRVDEKNFRLNTVPIVNLFSRDAEPIRLDHLHHRYTVRGDITHPEHYEVYSVGSVEGIEVGSGKRTTYLPLFSGGSSFDYRDKSYYTLEKEPATWGGWECYIGFQNDKAKEAFPKPQFVSLGLTCTNGRLTAQVLPGQICAPVSGVDSALSLTNLSHPTDYLPVNKHSNSLWRWVSHISMNFMSVCSAEQLRALLRLHDPTESESSAYKIEGILEVDMAPIRRLYRGVVVPGNAIDIVVKDTHFADHGEIVLLARVLSAFFSSFASINSYVQVSLRAEPSGQRMALSPRLGEHLQL